MRWFGYPLGVFYSMLGDWSLGGCAVNLRILPVGISVRYHEGILGFHMCYGETGFYGVDTDGRDIIGFTKPLFCNTKLP